MAARSPCARAGPSPMTRRPGRVFIEVIDTGIGMDEETRRRCLEPFFTTKGERGSGLGLAMVYGIAQRHDMDIDITSAPGAGTTFRLTFPARTADLPAVGRRRRSQKRPESHAHSADRRRSAAAHVLAGHAGAGRTRDRDRQRRQARSRSLHRRAASGTAISRGHHRPRHAALSTAGRWPRPSRRRRRGRR